MPDRIQYPRAAKFLFFEETALQYPRHVKPLVDWSVSHLAFPMTVGVNSFVCMLSEVASSQYLSRPSYDRIMESIPLRMKCSKSSGRSNLGSRSRYDAPTDNRRHRRPGSFLGSFLIALRASAHASQTASSLLELSSFDRRHNSKSRFTIALIRCGDRKFGSQYVGMIPWNTKVLVRKRTSLASRYLLSVRTQPAKSRLLFNSDLRLTAAQKPTEHSQKAAAMTDVRGRAMYHDISLILAVFEISWHEITIPKESQRTRLLTNDWQGI